jgi:regulatory protein
MNNDAHLSDEAEVAEKFEKKRTKLLSWAEKHERQVLRLERKTPEQLRSYAYNLAVWYLSEKDHTSFELKDKMIKKLVPEEVVDDTIVRLEVISAIDDEAYAVRFAESALMFKKWSSSKVRRELVHKHIENDLIDQALATVYNEDLEWAAVCLLAASKARATRSTTDATKREGKILRALMTRGYSYDIASRATREILSEDSD